MKLKTNISTMFTFTDSTQPPEPPWAMHLYKLNKWKRDSICIHTWQLMMGSTQSICIQSITQAHMTVTYSQLPHNKLHHQDYRNYSKVLTRKQTNNAPPRMYCTSAQRYDISVVKQMHPRADSKWTNPTPLLYLSCMMRSSPSRMTLIAASCGSVL